MRNMTWVRALGSAVLVLGVLVFVFVVENTRATKIRFFIPEVTSPLWLGLMVAEEGHPYAAQPGGPGGGDQD